MSNNPNRYWRDEAARAVAHHYRRRHEYGNAPAKAWAGVLRKWMPKVVRKLFSIDLTKSKNCDGKFKNEI